MVVRVKCGWWIAPLLAGALVLHLFMLTGVPERSSGAGAAHLTAAAAAPRHPPVTGHDEPTAAHGGAEMLSTCFAVLALITAGAAYLRASRLRRTGLELDSHLGRPEPRVDDATCRDGPPSVPSRVDAGVLLRV